jgi:hypothetical protein
MSNDPVELGAMLEVVFMELVWLCMLASPALV